MISEVAKDFETRIYTSLKTVVFVFKLAHSHILNYSHKTGKGGELTREKIRGSAVNKAGSKIPT